jgi:hypothetical protein
MKKFLVVLLSLGLIAGFSMTASAADVKVGGQYYLAGVYDNNPFLLGDDSFSQAYFSQRVRLRPVFEIAQGLTFTTQFDALEKQWGDSNWRRGVGAVGGNHQDGTSSRLQNTAGANNRGLQENIEFEQGFVTFNTMAGQVQIGYQSADVWGTGYGNNPTTRPRAQLISKFGNFTTMLVYEKWTESTVADTFVGLGRTDADNDTYAVAGIYKAGAIEAGLLYKYFVGKENRPGGNYSAKTHLLSPYGKATFGPVFIEAELNYLFGKAAEFEAPAVGPDVDAKSWSAYINGNVKFGPATVGALFGYVTGDDFSADKAKGLLNAGYGWNPALILMNSDMKWYGGSGLVTAQNRQRYIFGPVGTNGLGDIKTNTVWYQLYGAYKLTPKLDFTSALTYATVAEKKLSPTTEALSDKLGWELDVTATYKIYDNLSYMVGAGYLWAGDYFKLANAATVVKNNYILINRLTLNF